MENYTLDDIQISAFMLAKGAKIVEVTTDRPNHYVFIFQDTEQCKDLKREYLNNGHAPARELFARREELISEIKNRNGEINGKYQR